MVWMLWLLWGIVALGGAVGVGLATRGRYSRLIPILAVTLLGFWLRGGLGRDHLYGLEYEDAYVYAAGARHLTATTSAWNGPGLAVCVVGSISQCEEFEVYPGHLLGFPAVLRVAEALWGHRAALAPFVGTALSAVALPVVWWAAWAMTGSYPSALAAATLFAVTPVLVVYGSSACSETAAALPLAAAFAAMAMGRRALRRDRWWMWQAFAMCGALLSASVRRENAALLVVIPLCLMARVPVPLRKRDIVSASCAWIALGLLVSNGVFGSLQSEVGEFGGVSFGAGRLVEVLPIVIRAMSLPGWFGALSIAALAGALVAITQLRRPYRDLDPVGLTALTALVLVMVGLYASHVRSAYQLAGVAVEPFDFMRYLSNVGVPLSILASGALHFRKPEFLGPTRRGAAVIVGLGCVLWSSVVARNLRAELVEEEAWVRRKPALAAIDVATQLAGNHPVVTLEPLLIQLYGPPSLRVVSLPALTRERAEAFGSRLVYLAHDRYDSDVDRRRYAGGLAALPIDHAIELRRGDDWSVWSLSTGSAARRH